MTKLFAILVMTLAAIGSYAQSDYYWVGGTGNWSDLSHWATTSGGVTMHTTLPTQDDDVFFDANSFSTSGQIVTLDANGSCKDMVWSGVTNFPTFNEAADLFIYGSLTLSPDVNYDLNVVEFWSSSSGNTITSNGNSLGSDANVRFQGTGDWTIQDNFESDYIYLQSGTLNTNNQEINVQNFFFTGSNSRTLNLGSSIINTSKWKVTASNLTINAGTSTIIARNFYGDELGDGPFTYYDVEINDDGKLENTSTFNILTFHAGVSTTLESGATFTTNDIVLTGTKFELITLEASSSGSEATFNQSSGTINGTFLSLTDIHATGGATFNADQTIDNGNNTGWNITALTGNDYFWIGDGGDWSDLAHWATTSGGVTTHGDYPGPFDDVYFDVNSFSLSDQIVSIDLTAAECNNMDWTGAINSPEFDSDYPQRLKIYGSATFTPEVQKSLYCIDFVSENAGNTVTFSTGGSSRPYMNFSGDGEYTLLDSIYAVTVSLSRGTLNLNNQPVSCSIDFSVEGFWGATLNMAAAKIYARDWKVNNPTNFIFDAGTSTIEVTRNFDGEDLSYNHVTIDGTSDITGENTFATLEATPGSDLTFEANVTQTITSDLILEGTKANPITLTSTIGGSQATLSMTSGTVDAIFLVIEDNNAIGGATFNATQTIDNGNNTGWNITGLTGTDYYWVGDGGNWTDFSGHWATTSGGSTFHTEAPGILDNVIFDQNSFSTDNETVTIDLSEINFHDMDWSAIDQFVILSGNGKTMNVYGSLTMSANMNASITTVNFLSNETETISTFDGPGSNTTFNFTTAGTWSLESPATLRSLFIENGTFSTNNHDLDITFELNLSTTNPKTLNLGTSAVLARTFNNIGENVTFNGGGATFSFSSGVTANADGTGNTITFGDVLGIQYNSTDELRINDNMTFNNCTIDPGVIVEIGGDITLTVSTLTAIGTVDDPITIMSKVAGTQGYISQASGTVEGDYLILQDNAAIGGATFNANNSVNNGNVSGWTFNKLSQTITFDPLPDKSYNDDPFEITATASSGLAVTFSVVSGPISMEGSVVTISGTGLAKIQASQSGNIDYDPAASVIQEFTIFESSQTISFDDISDKTYGDDNFNLSAIATSGLDVVFSVVSGPITIDGNSVTINGAGDAEIQANQAGNDNFSAADPVSQTFTINKAPQTITFDALNDIILGEVTSIPLSASASSGLDVSLTVSGPASIANNTLTPTGIGLVEITASQTGDDNYLAADDVVQSFTISDQVTSIDKQVITILNIYPQPAQSKLYIDQPEKIYSTIIIYNSAGKVVYANNIQDYNSIDISGFGVGLYILELLGDKQSMKKKIILNK